MKKILFYNWDHLDGKAGGGVAVYQRNLFPFLISKGYNVYYINSGLTYTKDGITRIIPIVNAFDQRVKTYEIINSPIIAPVQQSAINFYNYLKDTVLLKIFKEFISNNGPFDVLHFNNIEGLSLSCLQIKKYFPNMKVVYSAHNYSTICPQGNLWKDDIKNNGHNCDRKSYTDCSKCYLKFNRNSVLWAKLHPKIRSAMKIAHAISVIAPDKIDEAVFEQYVTKTVAGLNENFDCILAVSEKVKQILIKNGIKSNKLRVSYIGTAVADEQVGSCQLTEKDHHFNIIYMGYMRKDKGFNFFMEALDKIPESISKNIKVRLVAKYDGGRQSKKNLQLIHKLQQKRTFQAIELVNGYTKDNQKKLLKSINLGIVPVMWEDNLPQVAIEQIAYGVPILVSNLGGVSELVNNERFVFKAGNIDDFISKFCYIYNNRACLANFFNKSMKLVTIGEHCKELENIYFL